MSMTILPVDKSGDYRTGTLLGISADDVASKLGFGPNCKDDESKVTKSWGFTVDGERCGIWDYKGSRDFSTFGPHDKLRALFGKNYEGGRS